MKKALLGIGVVVVIVIAIIAYQGSSTDVPNSIDAIAKVADQSSRRVAPAGSFIGFSDDHDTQAWIGIPYAKPPLGNLRWRAPEPILPLLEELQAINYHSPCVQYANPISGAVGEAGTVVGSEDCLALNIWAPKFKPQNVPIGDKKLPVMVWIHGGGNTIGSANTYQGDNLAGDQNIIYVGLNYRLGVLGWFSHDAIRDTSIEPLDASGNYGLLDMIAALQWVQDNIEAFGGDPDNVTIFGESAGGRDVYALIGSPIAKGLFTKAISQSGSALTATLAQAENFSDDDVPGMALSSSELISRVLVSTNRADDRDAAIELMDKMGSGEKVGFMRDRSIEEIFAAIGDPGGFGMYATPQNIRDGYVLPEVSLYELFNNKNAYNSVPMILGSNRDEAKLFFAQNPKYVSKWFGVIPKIKDEQAYNAAAAYHSDQWKALAVDEPAVLLSETQGNIYAYRFDWDEGPDTLLVDFGKLLGAAHGLEIAYVFGSFDSGISIPFLMTEENEAGRLALSDAMMNYWGEFARTGSPSTGTDNKQVEWKSWNNSAEKTLILDTEAGGGIRMTDTIMTVKSIKDRMLSDPFLAGQETYCEMYAQLFLLSYQVHDFWNAEEYASLGKEGCRKYSPDQFSSR
ncbi:MAG: para-nitrobenzyl esterase [Pseudomonadales bacterium]|jgi:para-nitrobenzyl esterase